MHLDYTTALKILSKQEVLTLDRPRPEEGKESIAACQSITMAAIYPRVLLVFRITWARDTPRPEEPVIHSAYLARGGVGGILVPTPASYTVLVRNKPSNHSRSR